MLGLAEKPEPNFHNKTSLQQNQKLIWQKSGGHLKTVTKVTTQILFLIEKVTNEESFHL